MDTRQQIIAQSFDRHLAVTANAGSGKTRVLVNRYVNILLNYSNKISPYYLSIKPKNIVAITFTRKAAAEMLAKVVRQIESLILNEKKSIELEHLKDIREQLTNAKISTIHSFCNDLLREFPVEAQVPPSFTEINEAQNILLRRESITSVLEEYLAKENKSSIDNKIRNFILDYGRYKLEKLLLNLSANPYIVEQMNTFYLRDSSSIIQIRNRLFIEVFFSQLTYYVNFFHSFITKYLFVKFDDKFQKEFDLLYSLLGELTSMILNFDNDFEKYHEIIGIACRVNDCFFNQDGSIKKSYFKNLKLENNPEYFYRLNSAGDFFYDLKSCYETFEFLCYDEFVIENGKMIAQIANEVIKYTEEEKNYLSGLDFEDMLIKTNELLKNKSVCKKLCNRIKFLLVDEFQDTNDLQFEIIKKLVPELVSKQFNVNGINLFIVGDTKQSIYGFRNANVRIFKQIKNDIIELNKNGFAKNLINKDFIYKNKLIEAHNENETLGIHILEVSFRLKPVISAFVNMVCSNIMIEDSRDYEFGYEPLVCTRGFDLIKKIENEGYNANLINQLGSVIFLISKKDNKKNDINNILSIDKTYEVDTDEEAELLAKHIKSVIQLNTDKYFIEENDTYRKVQYGDIAILARRKKRFPKLGKALLKYKIPFVIHSGTGIFDSPEINDLLQFLNFLINNKDDVALVSILRSPIFGIDDTQIYSVFNNVNHLSFWDNLNQYIEKERFNIYHSGKESKLLRAFRIIKNVIDITPSLSFSELIFYILDESGWFGTIYGTIMRTQLESDVKKLIDAARDFYSRGFQGLKNLVEELNFINDENVIDSEQVNLSGENVVNIMTIHASKGLEFPIVALFDTNFRQPNNLNTYYINEKLGITFDVQVSDEKGNYYDCSTPMHYLSGYLKKMEELAEEKRLLYVALTRAKDHLIISTTINEKKDGDLSNTAGLLRLILDGMKVDSTFIFNHINSQFFVNTHFWKDNNSFETEVPINISFIKSINDLTQEECISQTDEFEHIVLDEQIETSIKGGMFSATRIHSYKNEYRQYFKRYILGLPSEEEFKYSGKKNQGQDNAALIGTITHEVLQKIHLWLYNDCNIDRELLKHIIHSAFYSNKYISSDTEERILKEVLDVANSDFINSYSFNLINSKAEYSLTMPFSSNFILGKIDLLIQNCQRNWEIWDWKTNRIATLEDIERFAEYYKPQMLVYVYLLSKLFPNQNEYLARLLFTNAASRFNKDNKWLFTFTWNMDFLKEYENSLKQVISEIPF